MIMALFSSYKLFDKFVYFRKRVSIDAERQCGTLTKRL